MRSMVLSKAVEGFLITRTAEGYSQDTLKIYKWALTNLVEYLGDPELKEVTSLKLQGFYAYLQNEYVPQRTNGDLSPLKPRSVENAWTAMLSFFNWATEDLGVKNRPDSVLKRPRYKPAEITPFTSEEVKALLKVCERTRTATTEGLKTFTMRRSTANRDVAIIMILLDTGIRVSECARLQIRDINFQSNEVFVKPYGSGMKTKSSHVYLRKATNKVVRRYIAEREDTRQDDPVFMSRENRPMDRNSIRSM